jgi:hypothetical protein
MRTRGKGAEGFEDDGAPTVGQIKTMTHLRSGLNIASPRFWMVPVGRPTIGKSRICRYASISKRKGQA